MAAITPTATHYYLVTMNGQPPRVFLLNLISSGQTATFYQVTDYTSGSAGSISWYNASALPDGFSLQVDFGTTMPV